MNPMCDSYEMNPHNLAEGLYCIYPLSWRKTKEGRVPALPLPVLPHLTRRTRPYLHTGDQGCAGGQGCGQLCHHGVGRVAAGGVSAFPVGLKVISHMLAGVLQLVLIENDVEHFLRREVDGCRHRSSKSTGNTVGLVKWMIVVFTTMTRSKIKPSMVLMHISCVFISS